MIKNYFIGLIGSNGFVGKNFTKIFKKKKIQFLGITRENYKDFLKTDFDYLINAAMPSKRFWAKNNPELDYEETVEKTLYFIQNYNFKKFIHISSVSARCQLNTVYGQNKKKSENIVIKNSNNLILRLGPIYGEFLDKGVLVDMKNSNTVFIDGSSKYSFTNIDWIAEWILNNLDNYTGIKEIGSKDFIVLEQLAKKINSKSNFNGEIDNQIIEDSSSYDSKSEDVFKFLQKYGKK